MNIKVSVRLSTDLVPKCADATTLLLIPLDAGDILSNTLRCLMKEESVRVISHRFLSLSWNTITYILTPVCTVMNVRD